MRVLINGQEFEVTNPNEFSVTILSLVKRCPWEYASLEGLKENIIIAFKLIMDFCDAMWEKEKGGRKAKLTRLRKRMKDQENWNKIKTKEGFIRRYYELVLSFEGLRTLPGFGFTNRFGDQIIGNAEKVSLTERTNLLKGGK